MIVNIIGTGNLGKTIGHLLVKNKVANILSVFNRQNISSINGIKFIGEGVQCHDICSLPNADIIFISTPDDSIAEVCAKLSNNKHIRSGSIVVHCSGSLTSDVLLSMKDLGCYIASIHPIYSFSQPDISVEQYTGTFCAFEGDKEATEVISKLFDSIGSITYPINKEKKSLYHAAGVFASNYLVTLAQQSLLCLQEAGVKRDMAMQVTTNIMKVTLLNLEISLSPEQSLTGPIQRGDIATIVKHLASFDKHEQKQLYSILGMQTVGLTKHADEKIKQIQESLILGM